MIATSLAIQYLAAFLLLLALYFSFRNVAASLLKTAFFISLYAVICFALNRLPHYRASWEADLAAGLAIPLAVIALAAMLFAAVAYFVDRYLDKEPRDHFKGGRLFFRYGKLVYHTVFPVGLEEGATQQDVEELTERLGGFLWDQLHEQLGKQGDITIKRMAIRDLGWKGKGVSAEKAFLQAAFRTPRNAKLFYFIHLNHLGRHVLAHHYAFVQGRHRWHHVLAFIASAPFHIWLWAYPWVMGRYCIQSRLNRYFDPSSYGIIDLKSGFESIRFNIMSATRRFAKVYGLTAESPERMASLPLSKQAGEPFQEPTNAFSKPWKAGAFG
ncbi:MAG: hypothetical protein KDC66_18620 [Phaeodactylibacter sp.]|nr:hypothetical protein [Phaeodactylibacter sp.]MCB9273756.1 hypothetical protein [Lewinellaceae bacterium]